MHILGKIVQTYITYKQYCYQSYDNIFARNIVIFKAIIRYIGVLSKIISFDQIIS